MNKIILIGNICNDLELRYTKNNKEFCEFRIAINQQEKTNFIACVVYGVQAKNLCVYQKKGNKIAVDGSLRTDTYEVEGQKKYKTYVLAGNIEYLESKKEQSQEQPVEKTKLSDDTFAEFGTQIEITDEDLAF